jgi:hypothetical protein
MLTRARSGLPGIGGGFLRLFHKGDDATVRIDAHDPESRSRPGAAPQGKQSSRRRRCRRAAAASVQSQFRHHPLGEDVSRREPEIILKTDERSIVFEPGLGGKFSAKSTAWDENRVFLEGDKLEAAVKNGRWC